MRYLVQLLFCAIVPLSLFAQSASRLWTSALPIGAKSLTYSDDCNTYAYLISATLIVRGDAVTGEPLDTVVVAPTYSIAFAGSTVFLLSQAPGDSTLLTRLYHNESTPRRTSFGYGKYFEYPSGYDYNHTSEYTLIPFPGTGRIGAYIHVSAVEINADEYKRTGYTTIIDTMTFVKSLYGGGIVGRARSADDSYMTWSIRDEHDIRVAGGDDKLIVYTGLGMLSVSGPLWSWGEPLSPVGSFQPKASGWSDLVLFNNGIYDRRFNSVVPTSPKTPSLITNLEKGWMLGWRNVATTSPAELVAYSILRDTVIVLDTIKKPTGLVDAFVRSKLQTMFVYNEEYRELTRYATAIAPTPDTALFRREGDSCAQLRSVQCSVLVRTNAAVKEYRWFVNNMRIATSNTPRFTFEAMEVGEFDMCVEIVDTSGMVVERACNQIPLTVYRGRDLHSAFKTGTLPIRSVDLSPNGKLVALGRHDSLSVYELPTSIDAVTASSLFHVPKHGTIGFVGTDDSVVTHTIAKLRGPDGMDVSTDVHSISSGVLRNVQIFGRPHLTIEGEGLHFAPMFIYGKTVRNSATGLMMGAVHTTGFPDLTGRRSDAMFFLPVHNPKTGYVPSKPPYGLVIHDVDAGYGRSVVITTQTLVQMCDIDSLTLRHTISQDPRRTIYSALLRDDTTLLTSRGIYRYDTSWTATDTLKFNDGYRVVRLPNKDAYVVIRNNNDTLGHIISSLDGSVLYTWRNDLGTPLCAIYNGALKAIHVGHQTGILSTWSVPEEYTFVVDSVDEEHPTAPSTDSQKFQVSPNPVLDRLSISGKDLLAITKLQIVDLTGRSIEAEAINASSLSVANCAPGLYLLVISHTDGIEIKAFIKQ